MLKLSEVLAPLQALGFVRKICCYRGNNLFVVLWPDGSISPGQGVYSISSARQIGAFPVALNEWARNQEIGPIVQNTRAAFHYYEVLLADGVAVDGIVGYEVASDADVIAATATAEPFIEDVMKQFQTIYYPSIYWMPDESKVFFALFMLGRYFARKPLAVPAIALALPVDYTPTLSRGDIQVFAFERPGPRWALRSRRGSVLAA